MLDTCRIARPVMISISDVPPEARVNQACSVFCPLAPGERVGERVVL